MSVSPIPAGYHTVTPYLVVHDGVAAIEFYVRALGAVETLRMPMPDGRVGHAELRFGDSMVMLADEFPESGAVSPKTLGGTATGLCLYVADSDALFAQAVAAGAVVERPMADQFYGDRTGTVRDPFGHKWTLATHIEDVTPEEMARRMAAMGG